MLSVFRKYVRKKAHLTSKHRSDISPSGFSVLSSSPCGKDTLHRRSLRCTTLMVHAANICFLLGFPFLKIHTWVTGDTKMTHIVRLSQQLYIHLIDVTVSFVEKNTSTHMKWHIWNLLQTKRTIWYLHHVLFKKNAHFSQLCRQIFLLKVSHWIKLMQVV